MCARFLITLFILATTTSVISCRKPTPMVYSFGVQPANGRVGVDSIRFLANEGLPVTASIMWSFGDGTTSPDFSPTHLYTAAGTYTATLEVDGIISTPVSITISPALTSAHTPAMAGIRVWQRTEHFEPLYWHYFTDTFGITVLDQGSIRFRNSNFYCTGIETYAPKTLTFRSSIPQESIIYYYETDSIAYRSYQLLPPPYEHGYYEVVIHAP